MARRPARITRTLTRHQPRPAPRPARRAVLRVLAGSPLALSAHAHGAEQQIGREADRATLLRTLKLFEGSGLTHRVTDARDAGRHAACSIERNARARVR